MNFSEQIFGQLTEKKFDQLALGLFCEVRNDLPVYRSFLEHLHTGNPGNHREIPFLPIGFFKSHRILSPDLEAEKVFRSSGTTGMERSRHYVADLRLYDRSIMEGFRYFYGDPSEYVILALTPTPLENPDSSLVYMLERLIFSAPGSRFVSLKTPGFRDILASAKESGKKVMVIGLTWALLDLAQQGEARDASLIIVETGGMKGRRKELTREEVHEVLKEGFGVGTVHSEYSMSELLSQAWSQGDGLFRCPPWMRVLIREVNDPLSLAGPGQTGGICIIDLANRYSCPFIATQDLGRLHQDGSFEVLGRFDYSELRGCSLLSD